jgi:uncharacterized protein (TIGR00297 family)
VATLSVVAPRLGRYAAVPFVLVAAGAYAVTDERAVFEPLARPADLQSGRLFSLAAFALAAAGLALALGLGLPVTAFVVALSLVGYGHLGFVLARERSGSELARVAAFVVVGGVAAVAGGVVYASAWGGGSLAAVTFLATSGALLGGLLRSVFTPRDDPLVAVTTALFCWLLAELVVTVGWVPLLVALAVTLLVGYVSWALDAASVSGMLTGVLFSFLTVVLGGYGWLAALVAFFGGGALATKFRYEEKLERGVAEDEGGARTTGNVLGNSAAALAALLCFAAAGRVALPVSAVVFAFAFAGSVATALADTLSSEVGGVFDNVRLVTTLERVPPGTDGGITWQGELAGLAGAALVALIVGVAPSVPIELARAPLVVAAGFVGMTADSLLGAVVEGGRIGNQTVNFLATLSGGAAGGALALLL